MLASPSTKPPPSSQHEGHHPGTQAYAAALAGRTLGESSSIGLGPRIGDHRQTPVRVVTTRNLDPALSILTLARQRPPGPRKPGFKPTMPPLPGHHSPAELTARRKNRVLDRLLEVDLKDLARNKHNALVGMRIEAFRFRQRAVDLSNLLNDLQADDSDTCTADLKSYPPSTTSAGKGPLTTQRARPKTSVGFREHFQDFNTAGNFPANNPQTRPKTSPGKQKVTRYTSSHNVPTSSRKAPTSAHKLGTSARKVPTSEGGSSAPHSAVWGESVHGRPLFKVRGNKIKGLVTVSDDTESESDTESCSDFEDSDTDSTKKTFTYGDRYSNQKHIRSPTQTKVLPQRTSSRGSLLSARSLPPRSAVRTSYVPRSATHVRGESRDITGVSRGQATFQTSNIPRVGTAKSRQVATLSPTSEARTFRDPDYMKFVLGLEKDKYEINQGKIRKYLQNLQF